MTPEKIEDPLLKRRDLRSQARLKELQAELNALVDEVIAENDRLKREVANRVPSNKPKLTDREAAEIRRMHRSGFRVVELARMFDVNHGTISRIIRGIYRK